MEQKHIEQIKDELRDYGLVPEDLTAQELAEYDETIENELNGGNVLDGIRSLLPEKSYAKLAASHR
ncbi:MAG: hypothetical protein K6F72_00430 [Bacteroidales bacterium]|nr:hypothetical protein [Bacteroidales bacterium]